MEHRTGRIVGTALGLLAVLLLDARIHAQQPAPVGDMDVVINILKDPGATSIQKDRLIGKLYSGVVTIESVAASPQDKATVFIDVDLGRQVVENRVVAFIKMRFAAGANDEKVLQLRKGERARLRGNLKAFSVTQSRYLGVEPTNWADFTEAVVEGTVR